ncbi:MAG: hypothetical protein PHO62_00825 [Sulfurimonas sp.]|uniref:hypothetical protein n=1 Tax=Sulfurimonas sp. TaxID=2022749 RepID=UPI00260DF8E6|nr:hypothetical protein [Sulfurimonas sp.]MDD5371949.1 hypothetical protein [Sulfurimonas sp.]
MQTIQFQVEDSLYNEIVKRGINIQDELKLALNKILYKKDSYLNSQNFQEDKAYFQNALDEIDSGEIKPLSHNDVWEQIEKHSKAN